MVILNFLRPKARRRTRRRLAGCCLLVVLSLLLVCGALFGLSFYLARRAGAQEPGATPLEVMLIIDNSNSMYEKEGIGSDPDLLRIEAAHLFITYLGVDSSGPVHRLGVIFFGGQAKLVVPLTSLGDDARRAELAQFIANPPRMGWTAPQAALDLAAETFRAADPHAGRAVVLLTDGKPEQSTTPTAEEKAAIIARLRGSAGRFAADGVPLFIILLQNAATDADPAIEQDFAPLWQEMAGDTPGGRFYRARRSEELLDIYHDIVVTLTGRGTAGIVVQTQVQTETLERIPVEAGLAQVTFVIRKSDPALQVTVLRPDGRPLAPGDPGVQYGGRPGQSREEVWAVDDPPPGDWQVQIGGQGTVTVWKDFYPAPATPTPRPSPTDTPTATSTPTRTPTASPTPRPTASAQPPLGTPTPLPAVGPVSRLSFLKPSAPVELRPGDRLLVVATWLPGARVLAHLESVDGNCLNEISLSATGKGRYTGRFSLPAEGNGFGAGRYRLHLLGEARLANGLTVQDEVFLPLTVRPARWGGWWIGLPVIVLAAGGGWLWLRRRQMAPLLEGTLRRLAAPAGQTIPARLDLDGLRRQRVSLGPDPKAELHLPSSSDAPTPHARLVARREGNGRSSVALLAGESEADVGQVQVNQLPVVGEWLLQDGDVIQVGGYRFRYENLRRRAPAHRPPGVAREAK